MAMKPGSVAFLATLLAIAASLSVPARAQAQAESEPPATAPVPPHVEGPPMAAAGGTYCYNGPHPVDTRVAPGPPWDHSQGAHSHNYPPFDLRLFVLRDGCYSFVGDPRDFGYQGQVYSYYGAHPVHDSYGGNWCFMIGGHSHWWRPWSPYFVTMGPWFYWHGPYDAFFWSYWPYYATYYGRHYPRYYGGGRWHRGAVRGRDWAAAPPVGRVTAPPARAMPATGGGPCPGAGCGGMGMAPSPAPWPARSSAAGALPRGGDWSGRSAEPGRQPRLVGSPLGRRADRAPQPHWPCLRTGSHRPRVPIRAHGPGLSKHADAVRTKLPRLPQLPLGPRLAVVPGRQQRRQQWRRQPLARPLVASVRIPLVTAVGEDAVVLVAELRVTVEGDRPEQVHER